MKTVFAAVLFAFALFFSNFSAAQDESSMLVLEDGYFQVKGSQPVHLTHKLEKEYLSIGETFKIWASYHVKDGTVTGCGKRDDGFCTLSWGIEGKDLSGKVVLKGHYFDDQKHDAGKENSSGIGTNDTVVSRELADGDAHVVLKITTPDGKEHYLFKLPVVIR